MLWDIIDSSMIGPYKKQGELTASYWSKPRVQAKQWMGPQPQSRRTSPSASQPFLPHHLYSQQVIILKKWHNVTCSTEPALARYWGQSTDWALKMNEQHPATVKIIEGQQHAKRRTRDPYDYALNNAKAPRRTQFQTQGPKRPHLAPRNAQQTLPGH